MDMASSGMAFLAAAAACVAAVAAAVLACALFKAKVRIAEAEERRRS